MLKPISFEQFLQLCVHNDDMDVYDFVNSIDDGDKLREEIYAEGRRLLGDDYAGSPEPFRASCIAIGESRGINVLINY